LDILSLIFIVGFDVTQYQSFTYMSEFIRSIEKYCKTTPVIFCAGNKVDKVKDRVVTEQEARDYCNSHNPPIPYYETSAATGQNVRKIFEDAIRERLNGNYEKTKKEDGNGDDKEDPKKCIIC